MKSPKILALVLAGGQDTQLHPLTVQHQKSSVVFCGYRLVDFTLSNLVNSGIESIYLLAEHKSESLLEHLHANWSFAANEADRFVDLILPKPGQGGRFLGTADAVYQNIDLIQKHAPDLVAVFASDQVYRMDVRQMVEHHLNTGADATVAATQVPIEQASAFGIMVKGCDDEIWDFQEKPENPAPVPFDPTHAYASMGNYLFNTGVLLDSLKQAARRHKTDFGRDLLPELILSHHVCAYDFAINRVPGLELSGKANYWRDVGSLEAYVEAVQDMNNRVPCLRLNNPQWPMLPLRAVRQPASLAIDLGATGLTIPQLEARMVYH